MKPKFRYIAAAMTVVASIAVTPSCINAAYQFRGYRAFGGEYLVIPLGIIIAVIILELAKQWDHTLLMRALKAKKGGNRNQPVRVRIR